MTADDSTPDPAVHVHVADPFAQIPQALLYDPTIPAEAVRVYGVLIRHGADPSNCFPGHARIAALIGKSARSVPGWIKALEEAGWLERVRRWRCGADFSLTPPGEDDEGWELASNAYRIYAVPRVPERGVRAGERVPLCAGERGGYTPPRAPKESKGNESKNERENARAGSDALFDTGDPQPVVDAVDDGFQQFWDVYPRRTARAAAEKAWPKALRKAGSLTLILEGAARFRAEREGEDPQFTAHPATWLNACRWADEPLPPRANRNGKAASHAARDADVLPAEAERRVEVYDLSKIDPFKNTVP